MSRLISESAVHAARLLPDPIGPFLCTLGSHLIITTSPFPPPSLLPFPPFPKQHVLLLLLAISVQARVLQYATQCDLVQQSFADICAVQHCSLGFWG